ncbi:MAG TPA: Hpt domain-containing protein [Pseudolabrys sp.]|jgi:HPt (histidine-containing phosphotransfer) domain-containing protein|nr:Hpt domain-containing protein [Pseudolabrys sp.]
MASPKDNATSATYGNYEVITPENKLRKAVSNKPFLPGEEDPVARAEKALAELSGNFASWMESECDRLDKARRTIGEQGFTKANKESLFHAAHDIKGEAATFGFPLVAAAADSLCRLIEHTPDANRIPKKLIDQHVDAVRAIYREYASSDAEELASALNMRLREVTDDFLVRENRNRPDVIEQIMASSISIVPE